MYLTEDNSYSSKACYSILKTKNVQCSSICNNNLQLWQN